MQNPEIIESVCVYVCVYIYVYNIVYVCVCVCVYIYIYNSMTEKEQEGSEERIPFSWTESRVTKLGMETFNRIHSGILEGRTCYAAVESHM